MLKENYQNRIKELPESIKQFVGLVIVTIIIISFFFILNVMFGEGDELVEKMKIEEERIAPVSYTHLTLPTKLEV